jgi:hypothetical protein
MTSRLFAWLCESVSLILVYESISYKHWNELFCTGYKHTRRSVHAKTQVFVAALCILSRLGPTLCLAFDTAGGALVGQRGWSKRKTDLFFAQDPLSAILILYVLSFLSRLEFFPSLFKQNVLTLFVRIYSVQPLWNLCPRFARAAVARPPREQTQEILLGFSTVGIVDDQTALKPRFHCDTHDELDLVIRLRVKLQDSTSRTSE